MFLIAIFMRSPVIKNPIPESIKRKITAQSDNKLNLKLIIMRIV
jgi:hypothetical protein